MFQGGSDASEDLSEDRQSEVSSDEPTSYDITSATGHHELKKANDQPPIVMRKKLGFTLPLDSAFQQMHEDKVTQESESSVAGIRIGRPGSTPVTAAPKISVLGGKCKITCVKWNIPNVVTNASI